MTLALPLDGGWHAGPLFVPVKRRAPQLVSAFDGSRRIWGMVRRGNERRATPAWADRNLTASMFKLARIYTEAFGIRYSVDHEVPLKHPTVCGLHVGANFVIRTLDENVRKGNSWWPDMPEQQAELFE